MRRNANRRKPNRRKTKLGLPDLEHAKTAVLASLRSAESQRSYRHSIDEFVSWYCSEPRLAFNKTVVTRYRTHLEDLQLAPGTVNVRLAAVRRLAYEADTGLLSPELAAGIRRVKGSKKLGMRLGNWLTVTQARMLWKPPDVQTLKGKRDRAMLAVLLGCGLRRRELVQLSIVWCELRNPQFARVIPHRVPNDFVGHLSTPTAPARSLTDRALSTTICAVFGAEQQFATTSTGLRSLGVGTVCGSSSAKILAALLVTLLGTALCARRASAQMDPSGEWANIFDEDEPERIPGPEIGDYTGLPINAAARLRGDSWDATLLELPENQCRPHPSDYAWRGPALLRIWKQIDENTQRLVAYRTHISWQAPEQTIWMDGRPHPPDYARHTWQGFSTGKWEGDALAVVTDHLKEGWIRRNGIPRSANAVVSTHIMKHGDYLTVAVVIYDPAYLKEPFIRTTDFLAAPQQQIDPYPCESVEETDRPSGIVPHHLPGKNPFLQEFPANYGIAPEAARGGPETMYPEYIATMRSMKKLARPAKKHSDR